MTWTRAIGAVVVTVPSVSYILWPKPKDNDHGHGHGGHEEHESNEGHAADKDGTEKDEEDAEGGGVQNEQSQGDGSPEVSEVGEESWVTEEERSHEAGGISKDEESADESSSEGGQGQDTPASSDDDQTSSVSDGDAATEGQKEPQFKGPAEDGPPSDSRTSYSDSKGFKKKRIESSYGNPQGSVEGKDAMDPDSDGITDKVRPNSSVAVSHDSRASSWDPRTDKDLDIRPRLPSPLEAKTPCLANSKAYPTRIRSTPPTFSPTPTSPRSQKVNPRRPS